jgi:hypothetical protein
MAETTSRTALPTDRREPSDRDYAIAAVQRWRGCIDTQMHFNSMLMQARSIGVSIVIAVFGAAAVGLARAPDNVDRMVSTLQITAVVITFGLLLLIAVFVLDYFYYYPMLVAVVRRTEELERASRQPNSPIELDLSSYISAGISVRRATVVLWVFYGIPLASGLLFLLYIATLS